MVEPWSPRVSPRATRSAHTLCRKEFVAIGGDLFHTLFNHTCYVTRMLHMYARTHMDAHTYTHLHTHTHALSLKEIRGSESMGRENKELNCGHSELSR
jgi:hypothetical protein